MTKNIFQWWHIHKQCNVGTNHHFLHTTGTIKMQNSWSNWSYSDMRHISPKCTHSLQSFPEDSLGICQPIDIQLVRWGRGSSWREIVSAVTAGDLRDLGQVSTKWQGSSIPDCLPGCISQYHTLPCQGTAQHSHLWAPAAHGGINPAACHSRLLTCSPSTHSCK